MMVAIFFMLTSVLLAKTVSNFVFKDTDIKVVLKAIAELAKKDNEYLNIVSDQSVYGNVNVDLSNIDWQTALDVIVRTYNLKVHRQKNMILVKHRGSAASANTEIEIKVYHLKYIDAHDALTTITPLLSSAGKASVLESSGQLGWKFGTEVGKKSDAVANKLKRSKTLIISDHSERHEQIENLFQQIDVMPKQIMIKTRIMEVKHDFLKDIGLDWGTGTTGATTKTSEYQGITDGTDFDVKSQRLPSYASPNRDGFQLTFRNLDGLQFQTILQALESNQNINTLSAPLVTTLNNQEATILVGTKFPIIKTDVSSESGLIVGGSLQEYKDIGIQLNVLPQIWGEKEEFVNLIIHPAVSTSSETSKVMGGQTGTSVLVEYPIIETREAETQLIVKNNGTVMLGGLIKDVQTKTISGVPILSKIPLLGWLFKRDTVDTKKVELLIFITVHIVDPQQEVPVDMIDVKAIEAKFK